MKYILLTIFLILNLSFRDLIPTTYTATINPVEVIALSCETEETLYLITLLINSESGNQSTLSQRENFKNLNARVKDYRFPNTFKEVIYQSGQYDGVKRKRFKYNPKIYKKVLKWYKEDSIGYLYYYNPKEATDTKFINWSNKFTKHKFEDHVYFGKPKLK